MKIIVVPSIKDDAPDIVNKLLTTLLETNNYGERMGAAYGLAGIIKVNHFLQNLRAKLKCIKKFLNNKPIRCTLRFKGT